MKIKLHLMLAAFVAVCALGNAALAEEYRLQRGDTIALTVLGYPDLSKRATVDAAGELPIPMVGRVKVLGETVDSATRKIVQILAAKDIVQSARASVEIIDYAPLYISGEVSKPGSYAFRPGMTVRHAIALAGGVGMRAEGPSLAESWGQYKGAALALLRAQARTIRLEAERSGLDKPDFSKLTASRADQTFLARLIQLESEQFAERREESHREATYLKKLLEAARAQVDQLTKQRVSEEESIQSLSADLERMKSLFGRKVVPVTRVSDAVQALALVKSRYYESAQKLAETQRLTIDLERRIQRREESVRHKVTRDLHDALVELETSRARLKAAQMKMDKIRDPSTAMNPELTIRIFRTGDRKGISADESTELRSGDVVEVRSGVDEPLTGEALRSRTDIPE